jgi:hypothetical protein
MSEVTRGDSYNEDFAVFFEGELVGEADLVFRFAFAYTLDKKAAFDCVQKVYKSLVKDLPKLVKSSSQDVRRRLFDESYKILRGSADTKPSDSSAMVGFLKPFSSLERASLMMVEIGGIYPSECANILGIKETDVRSSLAKARAGLIKFSR